MNFRQPGDFLFDIIEFVELGKRGIQTRFANYTDAFTKTVDEMALFLGAY